MATLPPATNTAIAQQPRPSITATITRGECRGAAVTVDRDEIVDLIRRLRSRRDPSDATADPGSFTIGRQPIGDNHLFIGNADRSLSNLHLLVTPIEEDAIRITHQGRSGAVIIATGSAHDSLMPGENRTYVLPVDITVGNPPSTITVRHEDPCPTIDDGAAAWDQLATAQRSADNQVIATCADAGFAAVCTALKPLFAADQVVIADRDGCLASSGAAPDEQDHLHLWRWYAFNGRAYRLLRNLTNISLADGCSSHLGHGIVVRLFQGGTYLYVLRRASAYTAVDRERLTRIAWYLLGLNHGHGEWFPRMHLEDGEPMHLRRLVDHQLGRDPALVAQGAGECLQQVAPRIVHDTGILFPRRSRKPLSANAGLDVPRRHAAVAQASQNRYYHRLTEMLELFITDLVAGAEPVGRRQA